MERNGHVLVIFQSRPWGNSMNVIDLVKTDTDDLSCHTGITFFIEMLMLNGCTDDADDLTGYTASLKIYSHP